MHDFFRLSETYCTIIVFNIIFYQNSLPKILSNNWYKYIFPYPASGKGC